MRMRMEMKTKMKMGAIRFMSVLWTHYLYIYSTYYMLRGMILDMIPMNITNYGPTIGFSLGE